MEVELPASTRAKLVGRWWCKGKEVLFRSHRTWKDGGLSSQRPSSLFLLKHTVLVGIGRGGIFFFHYPIILLAFGGLRPLFIHIFGF